MRYLYLFIFLILVGNMYCQEAYFYSDSISVFGAQLVDHGDKENAKYCYVKNLDEVTKFDPYQINEYGFKDGRKFFSKYIYVGDTVKRVFLERLVFGKLNLYSYSGENETDFYLEKDSTFFKILKRKGNDNKDNFRKKLSEILSDCGNVEEPIKIISYSKNSLKYLITNYNHCQKESYTYLKYGINTGFGINKVIPFSQNGNSIINKFDYKLESNSTFGVFVDIPLNNKNLSFHTEVNYSKLKYSYYTKVENVLDYDFLVNISNLTVPLMLRYSFLKERFRPFSNIGLLYNYQLTKTAYFYETLFNGDVFGLSRTDIGNYFPQHSIGVAFGVGAEYKINYKNSFFLEFRFNYHKGNSVSERIDREELMLIGSVNI